MIQMRDVVKLLRVKHYIKNLLIFIPLFFAGKIFDRNLLEKAFIGFVCFLNCNPRFHTSYLG